MPAYFAAGAPPGEPPRNIPQFAKLKLGPKWKAADSSQNGQRGVVAFLGDQPPAGEPGWIACDGVWYLPGRPMPAQIDLTRSHRVNGIDYTTSRGITLTIPIAAASPRKLLFSAKKVGEASEEFAQKAFALFDRLGAEEKISATSPDIIELVIDAIRHVYDVTPEMLDELGWITSSDLDPIIVCLMGSDPKAADPAGGSLPSPAGA